MAEPDFGGGVLDWIRKGLQSNPMTGPVARVSEGLTGVRDKVVSKPAPPEARRTAETKEAAADTSGLVRGRPVMSDADSGGLVRGTGGLVRNKPQQPWVNDAGQMVYPPGTKAPIDEHDYTATALHPPGPQEKTYSGSVLPLRRDESGKLHFTFPEALNPFAMASGLAAGAAQGGRDLMGVGARVGSNISPETIGTLQAAAPMSGVVRTGSAPSTIPRLGRAPLQLDTAGSINSGVMPTRALANQAATRAQNIGGAASKLATEFDTGVKGGAPTALDTMTELNRAHAAGQPMTLLDVPNAPVERLARDIYRRGGEGAATLQSFLDRRKAEQVANTERLINRSLSDKPLAATFKEMRATRKANGAPLFEEVKRGGSTAPLAQQFEQGWSDSTQGKGSALVRVRAARAELAQAWQGWKRGGAPPGVVAAQRKLDTAMADLERLSKSSDELKARLQRALDDGTANMPGAVWSPRLQEMLDRPRVREGIRRGVEMMRDEAAGRGEPVRLSDYAIKGLDKKGNPIVGEVPNMSLLMIAKEGLDRILQTPKMQERFGGLNKEGKSVAALRDGLVAEMKKLSPKYGEALDQWAGDSHVMEATQAGRKLFSRNVFPTIEEAEEYIAKLPASAREGFIMGVASDLKNTLFRGGKLNIEDMKRRMRPLFRSETEANDFIDALERHHTMNETHRRMTGWKQLPDDSAASELAVTAAHGLLNFMRHRYISTVHNVARMGRVMGMRSNPAVDAEIARTLTNPNISQARPLPAIPRVGDRGPAGGTITNVESRPAMEFRERP